MDEVISTAASSRSGLDPRELLELISASERHLRTLAGASIMITGATGWFGVWLLDAICAADDLLSLKLEIVAVSRDPGRFQNRFSGFAEDRRISWIEADVRSLESSRSGFSHVIHGAADTTVGADPEAQRRLFDTLVDGTRRVIASAGPQCKSFLLLSSGAIYGPPKNLGSRFTEIESSGPDPSVMRNCYAEGKRAAEQLCAIAASEGMPTRIARCFAFVGPHMPFDRHFAIGNFIADAVRGCPILVKSDGRPMRSYLYMSDLVSSLLAILAEGTVGRPYNVGSDRGFTIESVAHCVNRVVGGSGVIIQGDRSDPKDQYVPDTNRLAAELGVSQKVGLEAAIARTAAWYRAHGRLAVT
jgi:nucleoside-diphosphate-sugar epimerase